MNSATNLPVSLYFDEFGEKAYPAIVLLPGLGSQSISWSQRFCRRLAETGKDIAKTVPGAKLQLIEGMGHEIPPALEAEVTALLLAHFDRR